MIRLGGQTLRLDIATIMITGPGELDAAFATIKKDATDAVIVQPSLPRMRVADLALKHRVPAIAPTGAFAAVGGLAGYSASPSEMARPAAIIDKILKGSKPADLPVEQPTKFELVINLKTAKAIGVNVPSTLLNRADEVIE
jgi:putative ABC transport system substrate-binding protein